MSDVEDPRTGDPDDRHPLGVLRGAIARGDVLELHGSEGSATIRIPNDHQDQLADVIHDLEPDDHLRADGGDVRSSGETERPMCPKCDVVLYDGTLTMLIAHLALECEAVADTEHDRDVVDDVEEVSDS